MQPLPHAPAGPNATAASPAGTGGHHQEHEQGDAVAVLGAELAAERYGRQLAEADAEHLRAQLAARMEVVEHLQRALAVACSPGFTAAAGQGSRPRVRPERYPAPELAA
ncbi:hypothetical protein ABZ093_34620 [Streptomyces cyaneofuscatus]|uniref:hypothetical protein n=1 Tax=Streptomyces cyaneofuscatus TaxID=66883 RepID=UPI00339E0C09